MVLWYCALAMAGAAERRIPEQMYDRISLADGRTVEWVVESYESGRFWFRNPTKGHRMGFPAHLVKHIALAKRISPAEAREVREMGKHTDAVVRAAVQEKDEEIARLRARIAELLAERAAPRKRHARIAHKPPAKAARDRGVHVVRFTPYLGKQARVVGEVRNGTREPRMVSVQVRLYRAGQLVKTLTGMVKPLPLAPGQLGAFEVSARYVPTWDKAGVAVSYAVIWQGD